jgi:transcriptional regulator with XRE-family HTH domain
MDLHLPLREIRQRRREKDPSGHTLSIYAGRLGLTITQLSLIERGLQDRIPADLAWGLHRVYGVPLKAFDRGIGKVA